MKAGIVVFSKTGNTLKVAQKLREALVSLGHEADILSILTTGEKLTPVTEPVLMHKPDPAPYEALFFGAPVWAFGLCPPMKVYLRGMKSLPGRIAGLFVTQAFPFPFLGGNRAIRQMADLCREKGMTAGKTAVFNWSGRDVEARADAAARGLAASV